jgi:hypothetical protein
VSALDVRRGESSMRPCARRLRDNSTMSPTNLRFPTFRKNSSVHLLSLLQVGDLGIHYNEKLFRPNAINGSEGSTFASRVTSAVLNGPKAEVSLFMESCKTYD